MQYQFNSTPYYSFHYPYFNGAFGSIAGSNGSLYGLQKPNSWLNPADTSIGQNFLLPSQKQSNNVIYPQYPLYNKWGSYPVTNWYDQSAYSSHVYNPLSSASQSHWSPQVNNWTYQSYNPPQYYWPMTNYFGSQMQYPNYYWPASQEYWGGNPMGYAPQMQMWPLTDRLPSPEKPTSQVSATLRDTSSDVLREYHLPTAITKRTASDIPRFPRYSIEIKKSNSGDDSNNSPKTSNSKKSPRASDSSIRQIASSRLFGTSMIFQTDSEPVATRAIDNYIHSK